MIVFTWGYRGRTREDLAAIIEKHGIQRVIDVRRNATRGRIQMGWRWPGYIIGLPEAVAFEWCFVLGNYATVAGTSGWVPRDDREAKLACAAIAAQGQTVLLLCAEPSTNWCHRFDVAGLIANLARAAGMECEVRHLP